MKKLFKTANANLACTGKVHPFCKGGKIKTILIFVSCLLLMFSFPNIIKSEVLTSEFKVYFAFDSSSVTAIESEKLHLFEAPEMALYDNIMLFAFADSVGANDYNINLSQKRLAFVQNYLKDSLGVVAYISGRYWGEDNPLYDSEGNYIPSENRCVRIILKRKEDKAAIMEEVKIPATVIDTVIVTKSGVQITIDTCTFTNIPFKEIEFEYKEALTIEDMKKYELQTIDNQNRCLSSGGMFYLKATRDNIELDINPECPVKMLVPIVNKSSDMGLYKMNEKTGKWYKSESEPVDMENENYSFSIGYNGWYNLDFPMGGTISKGIDMFNPYKGLAIQTKKTKDLDVYLVSRPDNFIMPLQMRDRDKIVYTSGRQCVDPEKAEIHISKEGVQRELHFKLSNLKYRMIKNKFVVDKDKLKIFADRSLQ